VSVNLAAAAANNNNNNSNNSTAEGDRQQDFGDVKEELDCKEQRVDVPDGNDGAEKKDGGGGGGEMQGADRGSEDNKESNTAGSSESPDGDDAKMASGYEMQVFVSKTLMLTYSSPLL